MNVMKKMLSLTLAAILMFGLVSPALAVMRDTPTYFGEPAVRDESGTPVDMSNWEEVFPYGTFVLESSEVTLSEGGGEFVNEKRVKVYRLGGTRGRATAYIQLAPAVAMSAPDEPNYINAAGKLDYTVRAEDTLPVAAYQPVGRDQDPIASGVQVIFDEVRATETAYDESGEVSEYGMVPLVADVDASGYQWYVFSEENGEWTPVPGATSKEMVIGLDMIEGYNYRCVYENDGARYSTDGLSGYKYESAAEVLPPAPDDLDLNPPQTFSAVLMEDGEYDAYTFPLTFAQGEWVKEIIITAEADGEDEADEFATLTIKSCDGGVVYDAQNTMAIRIAANGERSASYFAFEAREYEADKSGYYATLVIRRTGSLIDPVSVGYTTEDGEAVGGVDYDAVAANARVTAYAEDSGSAPAGADGENGDPRAGTIFFAPGVERMILKIPLIDDHIFSEDKDKTFKVILTEIIGASGGSAITLGQAVVRLYNTNSAQGSNAATLLSTGDALDLSASVPDTSRAIAKKTEVPKVTPVIREEEEPMRAEVSFGPSAVALASGNLEALASHDYGYMKFPRADMPNYASNYWVSYAWFANGSGKYAGYDVNNAERLMDTRGWYDWNNNYHTPRNLDYEDDLYRLNSRNYLDWNVCTMMAIDRRIDIPYFSEEFSEAVMNCYLQVEHGYWWFSEKASASGVKIVGTGSGWGYESGSGMFYRNGMGGTRSGLHTGTWKIDTSDTGFELFVERLGSDGGKTVGKAGIFDSVLRRRVLTGALYLAVHTADDAEINASVSSAVIWNAIKPNISIASGNGGADLLGRPYIGSVLNVGKPTSSTYVLSAPHNSSNINGVYLTAGTSKSAANMVNWASSVESEAKLKLITSSTSTVMAGTSAYTINVVMDRVQRVQVSVAPSGGAINGHQLFQSRSKNAIANTATHTWVSNGEPRFTESTSNASFAVSGEYMQTGEMNNLKSINFGLPEEDIILFGGRSYKGNETIVIPAGMLNMSTLSFKYYHKDYQQDITDMDVSISHVEQYIDANGNGRIDGYFDAGAGAFILTDADGKASGDMGFDKSTADILVSRISPEDYSINSFEPVYMKVGNEKKYVEQFFKAFYSMTPRALIVPAGASASDSAQALPIFTTNITKEANLSKLTSAQRGYRFIESGLYGVTYAIIDENGEWRTVIVPEGESPPDNAVMVKQKDTYSGDGKLMYQAQASIIETVDIPLGGNTNPIDLAWDYAANKPKRDSKGNPYYDINDWDPKYINHLIFQFEDPEPIFINNTPLGDFMPVAGKTDTGAGLTTLGYDREQLNAYLGSFNENETALIGIREQTALTDDIKTLDDSPTDVLRIALNTSNATDIGSIPGTDNLRSMRAMDSEENASTGADTSESDASWSEMNIDSGVGLPNLEVGVGDYVTVILDGNDVGFSIGIPLFKASTSTKNYTAYDDEDGPKKFRSETSGPVNENKEAMGNMKKMFSNPKSLLSDDALKDARIAQRGAVQGERSIRAQSLSVEIGFNVTIMFKYSTLDNKFVFSQAMIAITAGLEFKYTLRLTCCPIIYAYFVIGFEVEAIGGVIVDRIVELKKGAGGVINFGKDQQAIADLPDSGWAVDTSQTDAYKSDLLVGAKNASVSIQVNSDTFQITFNGKLGIRNGGETPDKQGFPDFEGGFITSDGGDPYIVKTDSSVDGTGGGWITLVALEEGTSIDKLELISGITSDTYFSGITISPELFLEVGAGIGVEILKAEVYFKASIGCTITFAQRVEDKENGGYKTEAASFDAMKFRAGLGVRIVLLLFTIEMDMIQFGIDYRRDADRELNGNDDQFGADGFNDDGWKFAWYAFNSMKELSAYSEEVGALPGVRIGLPSNGYLHQAIFGPGSDNVVDDSADHADRIEPMAIDPYENSPFQISGYASDGSAFKLAGGLVTGTDYRLVIADGKNYLFYTVSRQQSEDESPVDANMLVMSEVKSTGTAVELGLVKPGTSEPGYIVVDVGAVGEADRTGDLDFSASAGDGGIEVVWVSYETPYNDYTDAPDAIADGAAAVQAYAAQHTVVKRSEISLLDFESGFASAETVSPANTISDGARFAPKTTPNGEMIFHLTSVAMTSEEAAKANELHQADYNATKPTAAGDSGSSGDPSAGFRFEYNKAMDKVYGQNSVLNFSVWDSGSGGYKRYTAVPDEANWAKQGMRIENVAMGALPSEGTEKGFYLAYTASRTALASDNTTSAAARFLYLQKGVFNTADGTLMLGKAVVVRKLYDAPDGASASGFGLEAIVDGDADYQGMDGVYSGTRQTAAFQDPYFGNLKILTGKLGALDGETENFEETLSYSISALSAAQPEMFLLFEMNGNTYVIPQDDLAAITDDGAPTRGGRVIPFFEGDNGTRGNMVIGADSQGNISAVYTDTVPNSTNNAIYMMQYYPGDEDEGVAPSWGEGRMLAMNAMQAYENSAAGGWSQSETHDAYLDPARGGNMTSFVFSNLAVALGEDIPGDTEEATRPSLLIISQGTRTELEEVAFAGGDDFSYTEGERDTSKVVVPKSDADKNIISSNGLYGLSFGAGLQDVGEVRISFDTKNFVPGAELMPVISLKNTGDVPIRGSEANPITLKLHIASPEGAEFADTHELAEWKITGSIPVGGALSTYSATVSPKTAVLPGGDSVTGLAGYRFYITLSEDPGYFSSPFVYDSLTDKNGGITIDVEDKPDLAIENASVRLTGMRNGKPFISVNMAATNRGTGDAGHTYIQFSYQSGADPISGAPVYSPVDLTGHSLEVGRPISIDEIMPLAASSPEELTKGILRLHGPDNNDDLKSGYARMITGGFEIPASAFYADEGAGAGAVNLRAEIHSDSDGATTMEGSGVVQAAYSGELEGKNNGVILRLNAVTYFMLPTSFQLPLGTSTRLYVGADSTQEKAPVIAVEELSTDLGEPDTRHLDILYHETAGDYLVVSPSAPGQGVVRVSDLTTGSITDIPFSISEAGEGVNIFNDNGIFKFYDTAGQEYTANTSGGHKEDWMFVDNQQVWGSVSEDVPARFDLSQGKLGARFTFTTMAKSIELYFQGAISVESTHDGFNKIEELSCTGGVEKKVIDFGNEDNAAHTVTVTVMSDTALFDRFTETYGADGPPTPADDKNAPQIFWSRSMPGTAELKDGEKVTMTVYVIDDSGLSNIMLDGESVSLPSAGAGGLNFKAESGTIWRFEVSRTENKNIRITATDFYGNTTNRTITVDWFNVSGGGAQDSPLRLDARLVDGDGETIDADGFVEGLVRFAFTPAGVDEEVIFQKWDGEKTLFENLDVPADGDGYLPLSSNGVYRLIKRATDGSGRFAAYILAMKSYDPLNPVIQLQYDSVTGKLAYRVCKMLDDETPVPNGAGNVTPIKEVSVNGVALNVSSNLADVTGELYIAYNGRYTFEAEDASVPARKAVPVTCEVTDRRIKFTPTPTAEENDIYQPPWNAAGGHRVDGKGVVVSHSWDQEGMTGSVLVDASTITGGYYDETVLADSLEYTGRYAFALAPKGETSSDEDFTAETFTSGTHKFESLAPGEYTLYVRDALDTASADGPGTASLDLEVGDNAVRMVGRPEVVSSSAYIDTGRIKVTAAGGASGTLLFGIFRVNDPDADLKDLSWFNPAAKIENWRSSTIFDTNADTQGCFFEELTYGNYILAVRDSDDGVFAAFPENALLTLVNVPRNSTREELPPLDSSSKIYGYTVTTPTGKPPVKDKDGTFTLPGGGTIAADNGMTVETPAGTTIGKDGLITISEDGEAEIRLPKGTVISIPGGSTISADGKVRIPKGKTAKITQVGGVREDTVLVIDDETPLGYYGVFDNPFTDVSLGDWFYDDVAFTYIHKLLEGTSETLFSPDGIMTRGMLVTVLGRLEGVDVSEYADCAFSDVDSKMYYAPYIEWARSEGIAGGVGNNRFAPDTPISRQDLVVILRNYARQTGKSLPMKRVYKPFIDDADIANYARDAIEALFRGEIVGGRPGNRFAPKAPITRAEAAAMLRRFLES